MSDDHAVPPPPPPDADGASEVPAFPLVPGSPAEPLGDEDLAVVGAPQKTSLLRSSMVMASGTMVSRVLGFLRNFLLLACIGTGAGSVSAAFGVANNLPNTVYNLLAAGVFDAVLVPQIVRALKSRSGSVYVNRLLTLAGTILFGVTLIAMVLSPLLVTLFAKGYTGELRSLSIAFTLLCLPQIFFYGLYNLLGELLNARGIFGPYMWAPVVNNVVGIAGLVAFLLLWGAAPDDGIFRVEDFTSAQFWVLAGSATIGVVFQALVLILPMRRAGVKLRPDFHFRGTSFGSASKVAGWTFATLGISQIGILSTSNLATQVDTHAAGTNLIMAGIASYTTAFMIYMVPQSLISVSLATAIFTRLADAAADHDGETVAANYHQGVRLITLLSLLAAAILMAGAVPMMQLALPPRTTPEVAQAYSWVLLALMPGVASTGMVLMSQRVFFALEDARPVFLMGIVPTLLQVAVGWSVFALAGPQWWTAGAALGETACRLLQGFIAVFWVARVVREVNPGRIIASYLKFLIAAVAGFLVGLGVISLLGPVSDPGSRLVRYLMAGCKLLVVAVVVTAVYALVLRLIDPEDSGQVLPSLARRLPLPATLRRVMVGRSGGADGDNGLTQDGRATEDAMERDQDGAGHERDTGADGDAGADSGTGPSGTAPTPDEDALTWSSVGTAWSASDPTNTGEFPVVPRFSVRRAGSPQGTDLPSFDEILRPTGATTPPPAQDTAPEHEAAEDPDVRHDRAGTEPPAPPSPQGGTPTSTAATPTADADTRPHTVGPSPEWAPAGGTPPDDDVTGTADGTDGADVLPAPPPPGIPFDPSTFADTEAGPVPSSPDGEDRSGLPGTPAERVHPSATPAAPDSDTDGVAPEETGRRGEELPADLPAPPSAAIPTQPVSTEPGAPGATAGAGMLAAGTTLAATAGRSFSSWLGRTRQALRNSATPTSAEPTRPDAGPVPLTQVPTDDGPGDTTPPLPGPDTPTASPAGTPADGAPTDSPATSTGGLPDGAVPPDEVAPTPEDVPSHPGDDGHIPTEGGSPVLTGDEESTTVLGAAPGPHRIPATPPAATPGDDTSTRTEVLAPTPVTGSGAGGGRPPQPPSSASGAAPRGDGPSGSGPARRSGSRGRLDPTVPALVFALVLVLGGGFWGVRTALTPIGSDLDIPNLSGQSGEQSGSQSGEQSGQSPEPSESETPVAAPQIATPTIFSWRDDGGDNPDSVMNLIDGDPTTQWHSRSYDLNQFREEQTVTILLTLKEKALVSEIDLTMAPETSGGELVVREVTDPSNPRTGTELATSALSPNTTIKLAQPTELSALSLSFRTMPTGPDGQNWAWIYELSLK